MVIISQAHLNRNGYEIEVKVNGDVIIDVKEPDYTLSKAVVEAVVENTGLSPEKVDTAIHEMIVKIGIIQLMDVIAETPHMDRAAASKADKAYDHNY